MFNTIRAKLAALVFVAVAVALALGVLAMYGSRQLQTVANKANDYGKVAQNAVFANQLQNNLRSSVEQYLSAVKTNNNSLASEAAQSTIQIAKNIFGTARTNVGSKVLSPESNAALAKLVPQYEEYAKTAQQIASMPKENLTELDKNYAVFLEKFAAIEQLQDASNNLVSSDIEKNKLVADSSVDNTYMALLATFAFAVFLLSMVAYLIYTNISSKLKKLETAVQKVNAGDGSARTLLTSKDELGDLGRSFDALLDERFETIEAKTKENDSMNNSAINLLQSVYSLTEKDLTARAAVSDDIVGTIASSVNQFADETAQTLAEVQIIAGQVHGAAEATRKQGLLVQDAAERERVMLNSMGLTLGTATRQMTEVAQLSTASGVAASRTSDATKAAKAAVEGTMRGMDALRVNISETEKRFKRLGERSQEISSAVALVNTISERTHVLSLNASMQAATAGEAGRGFAVVAQEVQRLSDSSRQATAEIAQLVSNIQSETNETLITMNRLIAEVVAQTELSRQAGHEMTQTQIATAELVGLVQRIAAFSAQQQDMAQALQKNVQGINDGTTLTSAAIEQQTHATDTLVQFAQRLNDSVGQFKVA